MSRVVWAIALTLLAPASLASANEDPLERFGRDLIERWEVKPSASAPAWTQREGAPLVTFVQLADVHHTRRREPELVRAMAYVNETLRPDWVVLTGDNISGPTVEHHQRLRDLLREGLDMPFCLVQGDNDSENYTYVFGSSDWAFTNCGVRFVGLGIDADAKGKGIGTFRGDTLAWLRDDLRAHADEPAILFLHEPVAPPTFLDAARLAAVLQTAPNVSAVIAGHLHEDLEVRAGGVLHVTAPAVGPSARHGIKEYRVFADGIGILTHEVAPGIDRYAFADKWQWIAFRGGRRAHAAPTTLMDDYREMPARETEYPAWLEAGFERTIPALRALARRLRGE